MIANKLINEIMIECRIGNQAKVEVLIAELEEYIDALETGLHSYEHQTRSGIVNAVATSDVYGKLL